MGLRVGGIRADPDKAVPKPVTVYVVRAVNCPDRRAQQPLPRVDRLRVEPYDRLAKGRRGCEVAGREDDACEGKPESVRIMGASERTRHSRKIPSWRGCNIFGEVNSSIFGLQADGCHVLETSFTSTPWYAHIEGVEVTGFSVINCVLDREAGRQPPVVYDASFEDGRGVSFGNSIEFCVLTEAGAYSDRQLDVYGISKLSKKRSAFRPTLRTVEPLHPLGSGSSVITMTPPLDWNRTSSATLSVYLENHPINAAGNDVDVEVTIDGYSEHDVHYSQVATETFPALGNSGQKVKLEVDLPWFTVDETQIDSMIVTLRRPTAPDDDCYMSVEAAQVEYTAVTTTLSPMSLD